MKNGYLKYVMMLSLFCISSLIYAKQTTTRNASLWKDAYNSGIAERNNGNFSKAKSYFMRAYELGDKTFAPCAIGDLYYYGLGVEKSEQQSFAWYKIAAEAGSEQGMYLTALAYDGGFGVDVNKQEAAKWYKKVVDYNGVEFIALAANNLGVLLERGLIDGIPQGKEAANYYLIAAERGMPNAMYSIGMIYLTGKYGYPVDESKAIFWLKSAAATGLTQAQIKLAQLGY